MKVSTDPLTGVRTRRRARRGTLAARRPSVCLWARTRARTHRRTHCPSPERVRQCACGLVHAHGHTAKHTVRHLKESASVLVGSYTGTNTPPNTPERVRQCACRLVHTRTNTPPNTPKRVRQCACRLVHTREHTAKRAVRHLTGGMCTLF